MADLYKPISRQEALTALVNKFGAVETARYFLNDALSDLQTLEVGLAENNPLRAASVCESLHDTITNLRVLLDNKDYRPSIEKAVKSKLSNE